MLALTALLKHKEIPPFRTEVLSTKVPAPLPEAEMVKEVEVKLPVESESKTEPELSIPEVPAAGSDESVSEMVPPASVAPRALSGLMTLLSIRTPLDLI